MKHRRLSDAQREKIRKLLRSDDPPTISDLAKRFGIHDSAITKLNEKANKKNQIQLARVVRLGNLESVLPQRVEGWPV